MVNKACKDGARSVSKMKKTEIGVIPEDWEVVKIEDICDVDSDNLTSTTDLNYEIKYISLEYVDAGRLLGFNEVKFRDAPSRARRKLKFDDILVSTVRPNLKSHYLFKKIENNFIASTGFAVLRTNQHSGYIYNHFFANTINRQIENLIVGSNYPAINSSDVKSLQIPLPPLAEQEAIASALSDADAWIDSLEQLIAKKRLIKQGAMQTLLTPKEDWEVKKLGEVGKTYGGLSGKTKVDFGKGNAHYIPFMNVMKNVVIDKSFFEKVNLKQGEVQNKVLKNDLLFNGSSETPEELGISSVILEDIDNLYLNSFCFGFRLFDNNVNPLFLSYLFRSPYGRKIIFYLAQGATRYNLSKANFLELEISIPKSLSEQERIATILSDMDAELEALEAQLAKARLIKQGMMQELLTGKTRLV